MVVLLNIRILKTEIFQVLVVKVIKLVGFQLLFWSNMTTCELRKKMLHLRDAYLAKDWLWRNNSELEGVIHLVEYPQ